jgi:hypothetical protein
MSTVLTFTVSIFISQWTWSPYRYTFSPATVPGNAGLTTEILTVVVPSPSQSMPPPAHAISSPYPSQWPCCSCRSRARDAKQANEKPGSHGTLLLIFIGSLFHHAQWLRRVKFLKQQHPNPQSYTVTVTDTSGTLTHSTAVTVWKLFRCTRITAGAA